MDVLILAKDYPPLNVIAAQRPAAWAKYLRKEGHRVRIVTSTQWNVMQPEEDVFRVTIDLSPLPNPGTLGAKLRVMKRKLKSFLEYVLPYFLISTSRYWNIFREASVQIEARRPDVILATAEPYVLFGFAHQLSGKYGIPWVADYRDVWTANPRLSEKPKWVQWLTRNLYTWTERKWLASAAAITTACQFYADILIASLGRKDVHPVYNGHDISFPIPMQPKLPVPVLAYSGRLYPFQPIEAVLSALNALHEEGYSFRLVFFGLADWPEQVNRVKTAAGYLGDKIEFQMSCPYERYIMELSKSAGFVLLSRADRKALAAKIFDYLAFDLPLLLYPDDQGELAFLVRNHHAGTVCPTIESLITALKDVIQSYPFKTDAERSRRNPAADTFGREKTTLQLSSILHQAIKPAGHAL